MSCSWSYCNSCGVFGDYKATKCPKCGSEDLDKEWEEEDDYRREQAENEE